MMITFLYTIFRIKQALENQSRILWRKIGELEQLRLTGLYCLDNFAKHLRGHCLLKEKRYSIKMRKIGSGSGGKVYGRARYCTGILYVVISRVRAWGKLPHAVKKIIGQRGQRFYSSECLLSIID